MPENWIIRFASIVALMTVSGLCWNLVSLKLLRRRGTEEVTAKKQAAEQAAMFSLIVAFSFMLFMLSLASLFL